MLFGCSAKPDDKGIEIEKENLTYITALQGNIENCEEYLAKYPDGLHADEVNSRLSQIEKDKIQNQKIFDEIMAGNYENHQLLTSISSEVARELMKCKGDICLQNLKSITPEIAHELSNCKSWLYLNGLESISNETAHELSNHMHTYYLELNGLKSISVEIAQKLVKHNGPLMLNSLTTMDTMIAKEFLNKSNGMLYLNGLTVISVEVAQELAKMKCWLSLNGLKSISVEVAHELAQHDNHLELEGLTSISNEVALKLAKHKWIVHTQTHIRDEIMKYK